ncbi:MAG TPA: hypothetical protein VLC08_07460, partial [Chitinolyticbacter sp.]|nr:hypothetical protein [Chitinolyticbacter sp.]
MDESNKGRKQDDFGLVPSFDNSGRGSGQSQITPMFEQDYQRIYTLMQNKKKVMKRLGGLEQDLQSGSSLKDALYKTEQLHGFSPVVNRLTGLEGQDVFMGGLKEGMAFKDRG